MGESVKETTDTDSGAKKLADNKSDFNFGGDTNVDGTGNLFGRKTTTESIDFH